MRQGDQDWWRLADTISTEDRPRGLEHNAHAPPQHRLQLALGPVPCAGAIMTAPVVVLLSHPSLDARSTSAARRTRSTSSPSRRNRRIEPFTARASR